MSAYRIVYVNHIKLWLEIEEIAQYEKSLRAVGTDFTLKFPCRIFNPQYISIGNNFSASEGLKIEAIDQYQGQLYTPAVTIGDSVSFISNCRIQCVNKVIIGNNVLIASNVFISDHFHGEISAVAIATPPEERYLFSKGPVIIEDNVWIGENVSILAGVTIGRNAIVGAGAIVTNNVRQGTVVGGVPAKLIKVL